MRKLSKKISMLMVLAMLVSLFSGVVSASAASAWSFYNKTADDSIVAYAKDTYKMEKGQFADFDLYKNDEIVDTDIYTVKYESSDENVVWVDAKNGKLRADKFEEAEIGDTAEITAVIFNKNTEVTAERSFTIEIVEAEAEEAEYTLETLVGEAELGEEALYLDTAYTFASKVYDADEKEVEKAEVKYFIDEKEIKFPYNFEKGGEFTVEAVVAIGEEKFTTEYAVYVINNNVFEADQASMNSFTMTFAEKKDVEKVAANKADIAVSLAAKEGALKTKQFVKDVKADKDNNAVIVTLYNNFAKDNVITVTYKGESDAFQAVKGNVAKIVITDAKVKFGEKTKLPIKLYDEFEVDITSDELLAKVTVDKKTGSENAVIDGLYITMWAKDKTTGVQATYHTYTYTNGVENKFESDIATITSVDDVNTYSQITNWAITKETDNSKIAWDASNMLSLSDKDFKLVGKLTKTTTGVGSKSDTINTTKEDVFTYESSDNTKIIVTNKGVLIPVGKGSADILVKKGNDVLGVYTIEVVDARKATSMEITVDGNTVISRLDKVAVKLAVKDQFGAPMDVTSIEVKDVKTNSNVVDAEGKITKVEKNKVTFMGAILPEGADTTTYYRFIKVENATAYFEFTVKKIDGDAVSFKFNTAAQDADTSVAGSTDKTFAKAFEAKSIKVLGYDKNGMLVDDSVKVSNIDPKLIGTVVTGSVTAGEFYVTLTKPANASGVAVAEYGENGISFNYMKADNNAISKATAGNYVFNLYKAVQPNKDEQKFYFEYVGTSTITVKDAQKSYDVTVNKVDSTAKAADLTAEGVSGSVFAAAFQTVIKDVFTIKNPNANNAVVDATKFTGKVNDANYVVGNDKTVVIKKADIVSEFKYKDANGNDVTYTLAETVTFPVVSVTCK